MPAYAKRDNDGLYRVYDTDCSGVISGPYTTLSAAQSYCDVVNDEPTDAPPTPEEEAEMQPDEKDVPL